MIDSSARDDAIDTRAAPARRYLLLVIAALLLTLIGIEIAVRTMPHAYCKAEVDNIYGCASYKSLKRYLGDKNSRFYLGDSHVEFMVDYNGFRDYSMPAMLPTEMLYIMQYLVRSRTVEHVLIGLSAHHLQDKEKTRLHGILDEGTLSRQFLPFPVFALEPALTVGIKKYIWDTLFGRPLPKVEGKPSFTEEQLDQQREQRWRDQQAAGEKATDKSALWWQSYPLILEPTHWQKKTQKLRKDWALRRFLRHYPPENFDQIDEYHAIVGLLDLLQENDIKACFVRFPHSKEWEDLAELPQFERYKQAKALVRQLVEERNYYYLDTEALDFQLTTEYFRDSDHLLVPVIEKLTPVIVDTCFPGLPAPDA